MINIQVASARDVCSDGERHFKRHGIDDNPRPYQQIRNSHTHIRTDSKTRSNTSCPTILNERMLLRSRATILKNHEVETSPWQKLRNKFSREYLKHTEESKQNLEKSGVGEMAKRTLGRQSNAVQSEVDIPATVVFPPPEQRTRITTSESFGNSCRGCPTVGSNFKKVTDARKPTTVQHRYKGYTVINDEEKHRRVDRGLQNMETDVQETTSMSTIEGHPAEDGYAKHFNTMKQHESDEDSDSGNDYDLKLEENKPSETKPGSEECTRSQNWREHRYKKMKSLSDVDSDCENNCDLKLEENKPSESKPSSKERTHSQHRRERRYKRMKSLRCYENYSSDSDDTVIEKRIRYSKSSKIHSSDSENTVLEKGDNSRKKHVESMADEELSSIAEVSVDAESDKLMSSGPELKLPDVLTPWESSSVVPSSKHNNDDKTCSDHEKSDENTKKPYKLTRSETQILAINGYQDYYLGVKRTTNSNMAMVFLFVVFCSILLWSVDSLYHYMILGNPPEEKFWYEFGITDWFKLLYGTTIKYLENIVLPVPVK